MSTSLANVAITYEQRILHVSIACTGAYRLQHDVDHIHVIRNLYTVYSYANSAPIRSIARSIHYCS